MTHTYVIYTYDPAGTNRELRAAGSADDLLPTRMCASKTRRWQRSPNEADRDNVHVQFDGHGRAGVAIWRADVIAREAKHRNDVAVARDWVARGHSLGSLKRYGGYASVSAADIANVTDADIFPRRDAVSAAGYDAQLIERHHHPDERQPQPCKREKGP